MHSPHHHSIHLRDALLQWPVEQPVFFHRFGAKSILPTSFEEVTWSEVRSLKLGHSAQDSCWKTGRGWLVLCNYEGLRHRDPQSYPFRVIRFDSCLVWADDPSVAQHLGEKDLPPWLREITPSRQPTPRSPEGISLIPSDTDQHYLDAVGEVKAQIARGTYYQLNLLRYFSLPQGPTTEWQINRLLQHGGPFSSLWRFKENSVLSFSPEKFITVQAEETKGRIDTFPIKGTRPRSSDSQEDQRLAEELVNSKKDQAELNMIVDLMRNDLNKVCQRSTVKVVSAGDLHAFASVYHRIAHVSGDLVPGTTFEDMLFNICPAGSITGCPKSFVMEAIATLEGRQRGHFMGQSFLLSEGGEVDSSVLIRTLQSHQNHWEYAAGSGLTLASDPVEELEETIAKCRVVQSSE